MTLRIHTAPMRFRGADRLDVTAASARGFARAFAPSWRILRPALNELQLASGARAEGHVALAERIEAAAWAIYEPQYRAEMAESRARREADWESLLARPTATLCCYCPRAQALRGHCHRVVLAGMLVELGAVYEGEI